MIDNIYIIYDTCFYMLAVEEYVAENGKNPFKEWFDNLSKDIQARIAARIERFQNGNFGDHKKVV